MKPLAPALLSLPLLVVGCAAPEESSTEESGNALANGSIDTTYGAGGQQRTAPIDKWSDPRVMTALPSGDVLVCRNDGKRIAIVRYKPDGNADASFGSGGKVLVRSPMAEAEVDEELCSSLVHTGDGGFFAVAQVVLASSGQALVSITTTNDAKSLSAITAVTRDASGRIVVIGSDIRRTNPLASPRFVAFRYLATGKIDPAFSEVNIQPAFRYPDANRAGIAMSRAVTVLPSGKIVTAFYVDSGRGFGLLRLSDDGRIDSTFGTNGTVVATLPATTHPDAGREEAAPAAISVHANGTILVGGDVGDAEGGNTGRDFFLSRFLDSGAVDPSFGTSGVVRTEAPVTTTESRFASANAMLTLANGKILLGGAGAGSDSAPTQLFLAAYTSKGAPDASFGDGGRLLTDVAGTVARIDQLRGLPGGRVLAAGPAAANAGRAAPTALVTARYIFE